MNAEGLVYHSEKDLSFGGQGKNKQPRPKIRGSQFIRREEKSKIKLQIQKTKTIFQRPK